MKVEHFWQILLILIGAVATAYAGYWFGNRPEESSIIEYREDSNRNLKNLIGNANDIEIRYNKKSLNELSNTTYTIANNTKKI